MEFYLLYLLVTFGYVKATPWDNLTANIAVVEFEPVKDPSLSTNAKILQNTQKYIEIVTETNSANKLDLIIFPEATLRNNPETAVEIEINSNPCDAEIYPKFIKDLSCTARKIQTYLIINLVEKSKCDDNQNCKNVGFYFYNTDVIFDRSGTIISKYRKYNLFGEHELDKPSVAKNVTFETDFGIKFGIFTCFDIMFKNPAQDLLEKNVDGIIFPSMWYSELPFLTALQTQQMWAHAHDVTFFGSGANAPSVGSGGSGIYTGSRGTVSEGIVAQGGSQTFVYRSRKGKVPPSSHQDIDILAKEMDSFRLYTDSSLDEYNSTVLEGSVTNLEKELCYGHEKNRLCCNFNLTTSKQELDPGLQSYTYHLVVFSGVRSFMDAYNGGIELCAVIACLNSSISSCGQRFSNYDNVQWPTTFEGISVRARFENQGNKTQFPNSLLSSIRPIDASETIWTRRKTTENEEEVVEVTFSLKKPQNRMLTFGIYGRNFGNDSPPKEETSGSGMITLFLLTCVVVLSGLVVI